MCLVFLLCAQLMLGAAGVAGVARANIDSARAARLAHRSVRTFTSGLTARQEQQDQEPSVRGVAPTLGVAATGDPHTCACEHARVDRASTLVRNLAHAVQCTVVVREFALYVNLA